MSKWRERIDRILDKERGRIEEELKEAEGNYRDTGYQRYQNKMDRLNAQIIKIDSFQNCSLRVDDAESRALRYYRSVSEFRKMMDSYIIDHKGVERPIEETVMEMQRRLSLAFAKNGLRI